MPDTVLVTGISGVIAKHIALQLLQQGYEVRGTIRSADKAAETLETLRAHDADTARLSFVEADLGADAGWAEAVDGCTAVLNVASPFPLAQPKDRMALVPAARDGALRVLDAALDAGVERFVHTSSVVAMMYRANRPQPFVFGEDDWTDPEWAPATPYAVSKTLAERAVWDRAEQRGAVDRIVAVNPGMVLGPLLDDTLDASQRGFAMLLTGAFPMLVPFAFPIVDFRDVAAIHVAALTAPGAGGRRLVAAAETVTQAQMAALLRKAFPSRAGKVPRIVAPAAAVKLLARVDPAAATVRGDLGVMPIAKSTYVTEITGVKPRPARDSIIASARSLIERGLID